MSEYTFDNLVNLTTGKQEYSRTSFTSTKAGGVDGDVAAVVGAIPAGMAVNQAAGLLTIASGVVANDEVIIRMQKAKQDNIFTNPFDIMIGLMLSQRIVNNSFIFEAVDVLGDNLAFTNISTTQVEVAFPDPHGFNDYNLGQEIDLSAYGAAFATGIGYAITGALADADTTAIAAGDIQGMVILYA